MIYLINYELKSKSTRSYQAFYDAIKAYRTWWHYLEGTWLIKTTKSAKEIYNDLRVHLDEADYLFLVEVNLQPSHYYGFLNKNAWEWINKNR